MLNPAPTIGTGVQRTDEEVWIYLIDSDDNIVPAEGYLDDILEMDKRQFGGDRSELIKDFIGNLPQCAFVALDENQIVKGFIVVKAIKKEMKTGTKSAPGVLSQDVRTGEVCFRNRYLQFRQNLPLIFLFQHQITVSRVYWIQLDIQQIHTTCLCFMERTGLMNPIFVREAEATKVEIFQYSFRD